MRSLADNTLTDAALMVCAKQLRCLARLKVAGGRPTAFVRAPRRQMAARVLSVLVVIEISE